MVDFDRSAFIAKFQEEAADLLQRLNEGVIALETDPHDRELIDQMLRDAHTLKGSSRMVGLIEISDVAHRLEDVMVLVREGTVVYVPAMSDVVFEALDAILFLAENGGVNEGHALDLESLQARVAALATAPAEPAESPGTASPTVPDDIAGEGETGGEAESVARGIEAAAEDELRAKVQPTIRVKTSQVDELLNLTSEVVIGQIKAEKRVTELRELVAVCDESAQLWARLRHALAASAVELPGFSEQDFEDLDDLLVGQRRKVKGFTKDHADDSARMSLVVSELQDHGMRMRMLPASTIFQTFPRAMRDLAKQYRKEVEFEIVGGETELDKKVLEEINDPLVHIMRNAVDHGIEEPAARLACGKPAHGTIMLAARQEGDRIVIEVSDDGAGIDPDAVRAAAVRKGYLTPAEAEALSDRQAKYLIFEAGFSTSTIITEISGRGVGMDVVREFIVEKLKGSLDVESEVGKGTTFRLTIPLTLAIIRALLLRVGHHSFALPTGAVDETLRIDPSEIMRVEGRDVIRRGRRTIPLVRLSDLLGIPSTGAEGAKMPIVTVGYSGQRLGFVADALDGEQQIVIKPLGSHLAKIDNIAGVTVIGAGDIVPILNVPDLVLNARNRAGQRAGAAARIESPGIKTILVCEDSFTTRELERSIFESAGYAVETAPDGAAGLGKLRDGLSADIVVTDVQMPNMTGFELTSAIKADPLLQDIPVVIVTSLEREEEKAQGIEAGADAYITKSVFNQDTLLDTVERLIR
jgi:two-component system chemotaxis sensor kinase CheA